MRQRLLRAAQHDDPAGLAGQIALRGSLLGTERTTASLRSVLIALLLQAWLGSVPVRAQDIPIFDAHLHYNQPDWEALTATEILGLLDQAGVRWALVSSTPDDGTLTLYEAAPKRIIPSLRPYRSPQDRGRWHDDPAVQAYVEERLKRGVYKAIGEFHLEVAHVDTPVMRRCAELAVQHQLVLHVHVDAQTVEKLSVLYPRARLLWAHAGMSASAATVAQLVERFPHLWVELSLRSDIAPEGRLDPAWRDTLVRFPERFLVGTDTWMTGRWGTLVAGMQTTRRWLTQLPPAVAEGIAYGNAARLFGLTLPHTVSWPPVR